MDFLKSLFDEGALTWEQFSEKVSKGGFKVADLATGNYVDKKKYEDAINTRTATINELNTQITTRDGDIAKLKKQLEDNSGDNTTKIANLTQQLNDLQTTYSQTKDDYEKRISKQNYEFAVKDFANSKKFTSQAAKRDFINEMINKNLQLQDNKILGAEDFVTSYKENNADAFVVEADPNTVQQKPNPNFVNPQSNQTPPPDNAFVNAFNFVGVRPHDKK